MCQQALSSAGGNDMFPLPLEKISKSRFIGTIVSFGISITICCCPRLNCSFLHDLGAEASQFIELTEHIMDTEVSLKHLSYMFDLFFHKH